MRERFTENAEKVLKLAKKAAKNNGNGYIGSEHLLLGLLEEGEGTAAILLKESGADTVKIRTLVANLITSEGDTLTEETDYTPRTEIILENAVHEAISSIWKSGDRASASGTFKRYGMRGNQTAAHDGDRYPQTLPQRS